MKKNIFNKMTKKRNVCEKEKTHTNTQYFSKVLFILTLQINFDIEIKYKYTNTRARAYVHTQMINITLNNCGQPVF